MTGSQSGERVLISFDYALKHLLRNKSNYEVLEGFLSELLKNNVSVKSIGESESNKEHAKDKYNKVDILVEDESDEIILIELQFIVELDYLHRILYGTSKAITERMVEGAKYQEVRKIYSISIVYFDLGQGDDYVYHGKTRFTGLHKKDELRLSKSQRETFGRELAGDIYPEYYILKINNFDDKTKDTLDEWIYFFKYNIIKDEFNAKGFRKAREILDRANLTPEEQLVYDYVLRQRSEELSALSSYKDEGRIEGREEGRIEREKLAEELEKERAERVEREKEFEKKYADLEKEREREREIFLAEIAKLKQNKQE
jgi:predicted transposase/invertase (TIGR01784 family)